MGTVGDQTCFFFLCRLQFCMVLLASVYCVNDIPDAKHDRLVAVCSPIYHGAADALMRNRDSDHSLCFKIICSESINIKRIS